MSDDRVARPPPTEEIAQFPYAGAEMLDERRRDEWQGLPAGGIRSWVRMRRNEIWRHPA